MRAYNALANSNEWGFVIVRCTYSSQSQWDEYIFTLKHEANHALRGAHNQDLRDSSLWTVLENPSLDGATYFQASQYFGHWSREERRKRGEVAKELDEFETEDELIYSDRGNRGIISLSTPTKTQPIVLPISKTTKNLQIPGGTSSHMCVRPKSRTE